MFKNYLLLPFLALITNALAFEKPVHGDPQKTTFSDCFSMPELTVLHPRCESPETGTITVTFPVSETYRYSIDGVTYQESPFFDLVLPGIYHVSYKDESGCTSEMNTVAVDPAMPYAIINLDAQSSLMQTVCLNSAVAPIVYTLGGTATDATVSGLPPGLSTTFSNGVFTIGGNATALGIYNFSIVSNGSCQALLNGIIMVRLNAALAWMSSSGSRNQTLCQQTAITPIRHIVANGATGAETNGLPSGISGTFSGGIYTISGTPDVPGTYNYTISTTGGCSVATVGGVITINAVPVLGLQCINAPSSNVMAFDWEPVSGVTGYNYSYTIGNGSAISGTTASTQFTVPGVLSGQSVAFSVNGFNVPGLCFAPQSVTCTLQSLGIGEFEKQSFRYYPNPTQGILNIESDDEIGKLAIFNTLGQQVMDSTAFSGASSLDVSHLQNGIYFVKMDKSNTVFRFVKE